jgi:hypothetical protein
MSCGHRNPVGLRAGRLYSWVLTWKSAAMLDRGERNTLVSSTFAPIHVERPPTAAV